MAASVIVARWSNIAEVSMPTADQIADAFSRSQLGPRPDDGGFVGPSPRITRTAPLGSFQTVAAWVYTWPRYDPASPPSDRAPLRELVELLRAAVARNTGADSVTVERYTARRNGALSWWASGEAAITRTRDVAPSLAGRFDAPENPIGPTTDATHPTTVADAARGIRSAGALALAAAAAVGVVVVMRRRR